MSSLARFGAAGPLLLLCCLALHVALAAAYKLGDPVAMLKRSQYKGYRTAWSEVVSSDAPKFGVFKSVRLASLADAAAAGGSDLSPTDELKVSFSFAGEKHLVPWITITDGKAHFVQAIDFTFVYAQGHVLAVRWKTTYYDEAVQKPDFMHLNYHWEERLTSDPALGLNVVLLVCMSGAGVAALLVMLGWDRPSSTAKDKSRRVGTAAGGTGAASTPRRSPAAHMTHGATWHAEDVHDL